MTQAPPVETLIVYVDDAVFALEQLQREALAQQGPRRWLVVAFPPRAARGIGRLASQSTRRTWLAKWSGKVFDALLPMLRAQGDEALAWVADEPLPGLGRRLAQRFGPARVLDARRPDALRSPAPSRYPPPDPAACPSARSA